MTLGRWLADVWARARCVLSGPRLGHDWDRPDNINWLSLRYPLPRCRRCGHVPRPSTSGLVPGE